MRYSRPIPARGRGLAAIALSIAGVALASCASRWEPPTTEEAQFAAACPDRRAPAVDEFGEAGVRGTYHVVVQDAPDDELAAFIGRVAEHGFGLVPLTIDIDGLDTMVVTGTATLRTQHEVDVEFDSACGMGGGKIYLTHVRYNPATEAGGPVQVR